MSHLNTLHQTGLALLLLTTTATAQIGSYEAGTKAFRSGDFAEAIEQFAVYRDEHPGNPWGYYMCALAEHRSGDLEAAANDYQRAIKIQPTLVKAHRNLARVELDRARPDSALTPAQQATEIDPGDAQSWRVLGRVHHTLGAMKEATLDYERSLDIEPSDGWTLNNLGYLKLQNNDAVGACALLEQAAELLPDQAVVQNNLGVAFERCGDRTASSEAYTRAAELGSEKARVNLARAWIGVDARKEHRPGAAGLRLSQGSDRSF